MQKEDRPRAHLMHQKLCVAACSRINNIEQIDISSMFKNQEMK